MQRTAAHCFVESEETAATLRRALTDHRLAKLAAKINPGGLATARAFYASHPSPPLLLVEALEVDADALLAGVDALAEVCAPDTSLILLGAINDVEVFRQLTRRGVADYLAQPFDAERLAQALLDGAAEPGAAAQGRAVAFFAAKGGAGASTLAHHVAWALSRADDVDAAVVDLDLPFGSADLSFNLDPTGGVRNLLGETERVDGALLARFAARHDDRLSLFAAPAVLEASSIIDPIRLESVLDAVRAHHKITVVDLPRVWGAATQSALRWADQVAIVASLDLPSLRNARNVMDWLAAARPGAAPPLLALTGAGREAQLAADDFARSLNMTPTVSIPWDANAFRLAAAAGQTVFEAAPKSRAAAEMQAFANAVAARALPRRAEPPARKSLTARLIGMVTRK